MNGGKMGNQEEPTTERKAKSGRPKKAPATEVEPGDGIALLRDAINREMARECDQLAKALVKLTKAGNRTGASLLSELSGANIPPPPKQEKFFSFAALLASEPEWKGPIPGAENAWVDPHSRKAA